MTALTLGVLGVAGALAAGPGPASAGEDTAGPPGGRQEGAGDGVVRSAHLVAEVAAGGNEVEVRVRYAVSPGAAVGGALRLELLDFGPATVESLRVEPDGGSPDAAAAGPAGVGAGESRAARGPVIALVPERGSMRAASLPLAAVPPGADLDGRAFTLVYRVVGAVEREGPEVRVRVPVLVVDLPPEQRGDRVFRASLGVPDGWSVWGGFPTGLAPTPEGAWEVRLPVVPSLVSLRGRSDGARRPGLPEALDLLALTLLLGFGLVGWRHLREVAGVERAGP